MEKPLQLQIGVFFDVAQEGGGIKLVERLPLQGEHGFGGFAQAALPCKQRLKFGTDAVFLFGNDCLQERVFAAVIFVKGNAADGGLGADSTHGYGGKAVFAEQAAGGVGDGLLFAGGHDGRKVLILFIKGFIKVIRKSDTHHISPRRQWQYGGVSDDLFPCPSATPYE